MKIKWKLMKLEFSSFIIQYIGCMYPYNTASTITRKHVRNRLVELNKTLFMYSEIFNIYPYISPEIYTVYP